MAASRVRDRFRALLPNFFLLWLEKRRNSAEFQQDVLILLIAGLFIVAITSGLLLSKFVRDDALLKFALTLLGMITGTLFSLLFTGLLDALHRPVFEVESGKVPYNPLSTDPRPMETLLINVTNKSLGIPYRWITSRAPVLGCYAKITFYHRTGTEYQRAYHPMTARWRSLAQPSPLYGFDSMYFRSRNKPMKLKIDWGHGPIIYDPVRFDPLGQKPGQRMDLFSGQTEDIDVVCRFRGETKCFGFNNEFYCPPQLTGYRREWNLPEAYYLVKVSIFSSAPPAIFYFNLYNFGHNFNLLRTCCPRKLPLSERGP